MGDWEFRLLTARIRMAEVERRSSYTGNLQHHITPRRDRSGYRWYECNGPQFFGGTGVYPSVSFSTVLTPGQRFGWTIIYHDYTYRNSLPYVLPTTSTYVPLISGQLIPVLPLSLGSVSLWSAIMSVFLLTGSELLSPIYSRTGILINRRRLRIAALILVTIFLITTAYQIAISQPSLFSK